MRRTGMPVVLQPGRRQPARNRAVWRDMNAQDSRHGSVIAIRTVVLVASRAALADTARHDPQIDAGKTFGDRLISIALTGRDPALNDNAASSGRYPYRQVAGVSSAARNERQLRSVARLAVNDASRGLTTADPDVLPNLAPALTVGGRRVVLYTELGARYALIELHHLLLGSTDRTPVMLTGRNDYTDTIGMGAQYYPTTSLRADIDLRYVECQTSHQARQPRTQYRRNAPRERLHLLILSLNARPSARLQIAPGPSDARRVSRAAPGDLDPAHAWRAVITSLAAGW
jgi:hypothetical protein